VYKITKEIHNHPPETTCPCDADTDEPQGSTEGLSRKRKRLMDQSRHGCADRRPQQEYTKITK